MNEETKSQRGELVRDAAVFQLKLMADGFRDLALVPVSLIVAAVGVKISAIFLRPSDGQHR